MKPVRGTGLLIPIYMIHRKRGAKAMDDMNILPRLKGRAIHDGWASYMKYDVNHSLCNVHHLRRLAFLQERYPQGWESELADLLLEIKEVVEKSRATQSCLSPQQVTDFESHYDRLVEQGLQANSPPEQPERQPGKRGRIKQTPPKNMLDRLRDHKEAILGYLPFSRVNIRQESGESLKISANQVRIQDIFPVQGNILPPNRANVLQQGKINSRSIRITLQNNPTDLFRLPINDAGYDQG